MTWLKLDDAIDAHDKIAPLGPLAFNLHIKAMLYCARNLTDGFLPATKARTLVDVSAIYVAADDPDGRGSLEGEKARRKPAEISPLIEILVEAGLWEIDRERRGYAIHDFLDYNPTREKVEADREAARLRMQRKRAGSSEEPSDDVRANIEPNNGRSSRPPVPVPVPEENDPT